MIVTRVAWVFASGLCRWSQASLVPDASLCIGNRRPHSHGILSEIDANDDTHHSTILGERSNDVHAVGRLIEMPWLVDTIYNSGSLIETKPQSKLNPSPVCLLIDFK